MSNQNTNKLLMIKPVAFGYNNQTAIDNYFQRKNQLRFDKIQEKALCEFQNMLEILIKNGLNIVCLSDTMEPHTPDSIFPNNWISFHANNIVVIYSMFTPNRREEKRLDILDKIYNTEHRTIIDLSYAEINNQYLEGTGSMVLDRCNKIAFASISQRTDKRLFTKFCSLMGYTPVAFHSYYKKKEYPIYHTNVMMSICSEYVIICKDSILDKMEQRFVYQYFSRKEIIEITLEQMMCFAGNCLQVFNNKKEKLLLMSETAYKSLDSHQKKVIHKYNRIITIPIETIERTGGGSVRCMLAEIFY